MTSSRKRRHAGLILGLCLICAAMAAGMGCGKKAPPRAPEKPGQAVAAPENLVAEVTDGRLTLTWTHETDPVDAVVVPRYFEVSMALPTDCEGCPFVFRTVGQVAMPDMVFQMSLSDPGVRYFRVQAVGDPDVRSEYSRTETVEMP
ncbi:MAG: fibronectin type III domain-containing protein [Desulfotignum sp.]